MIEAAMHRAIGNGNEKQPKRPGERLERVHRVDGGGGGVRRQDPSSREPGGAPVERGDCGRVSFGFVAAALLVTLPGGLACRGDAPALADCAPRNGLTPICRFQAPEDLAVVGHWLVVSQMPNARGPGSLVAFHPATRSIRKLYPAPLAERSALSGGAASAVDASDADAAAVRAAAAAAPDGGCSAGAPPPFEDFAPHGIDVEGTRLLVVNHGRREAIEEFALSGDRGAPALTWKSCTPLPADASANDVVALAGGGFAATKMIERPHWLGIVKLLLGLETGALLRYSPESGGWETVPNSEGRAPNGVEVDEDGTFFIAEWTGRRIVRLEPDGSGRETAELDFSPDNLAWASDGRLLVAGQRASVLDVPACAALEEGTCALPSVVVAVDPSTLEVFPLIDEDPPTALGAASIAVELDGSLWIGAFVGDRIVRRDGLP